MEFTFSRFIIMLPSLWSFSFRNTFRCVASFYVTLADNLTSHQVSAGNSIHSLCCAILPSSVFVTQLSERNGFELRDAVVVSLKKES